MYRYNFPLFPTDQFFAASGNPSDWSTSGNESQDGRLSYIGRLNYDYGGKYLFSSSVRRDGSIKFAPNKRWGWFPSAAAGWVISKENFFQNSKVQNSIDMLKLRSIGLSDFAVLEGRQRIGRIRLTTERMPCVWLWSITVHLPGGTFHGLSRGHRHGQGGTHDGVERSEG